MTFEPAPSAAAKPAINPILKLVLEIGPLGVFFFANARGEWLAEKLPALAALGGPIFVATALFLIATILALTVSLILTRRLPVMPFVTGIVVLVFGGLTLWLQDETFIKLKVTIINALFGAALLGGLAFGRPLLGYVFEAVFQLTEEGWRKLSFRWGIFFLALAVLNEIVRQAVSTDMWVNFKVFGIIGLTFVFTMTQIPLINRYQVKEEAEPG